MQAKSLGASQPAKALTAFIDYEGIFKASPLAIILYSLDRTVHAWNGMAQQLFGWTAEEVIGRALPVPESAREQWLLLQEQLLRGETFINVESRRLCKDGSEVDVILSGSPVRNPEGDVVGFISVIGDACQVLRIERALAASEQRRLLSMDAAEMGNWSWDLSSNKIQWDANCKRLFGFPPDAPNTTFDCFFPLLYSEDQQATRAAVERAVLTHGEYDMIHRVVWPDQTVHWLRCKGRLLEDADGRRMIGVSIDATWIKNNEDLIRQASRLSASGRVANELAHEINNPLEILCNSLYLLQLEHGEDTLLIAAQDAFDRIAHITKQILGVHSGTAPIESVDVCSLADTVVQQLQPRVRAKNVRLETRYEQTKFVGCAEDVRNIISHLLENALDAVGAGGQIVVRIGPPKRLDVRSSTIEIVVADNGTGIPAKIREQLYSPFVSTKPRPGSGLGLWICHLIASRYGGRIRLHTSTTVGRSGTCVAIRVPSQLAAPRAAAA